MLLLHIFSNFLRYVGVPSVFKDEKDIPFMGLKFIIDMQHPSIDDCRLNGFVVHSFKVFVGDSEEMLLSPVHALRCRLKRMHSFRPERSHLFISVM